MRIAHLTWSLGIGGIQTMLIEIANRQIAAGHEVGIFVIDSYVSEYITSKLDPKIEVFYMGRTRGHKAIIPFIKLNWYLWRYKADIIHSHAANLIKVVFVKKPIIGTVHGNRFVRGDFSPYPAIYAISKSIQDDCLKCGLHAEVIENGIPCDKIKQRSISQNREVYKIVQVSRVLFEHKGQDLLLEAVSRLRKRIIDMGDSFHVELHFVGDGVDFEKLQIMIKELKMEDCTKLWGFQSQEWVHEHLCDFDLFVQPSRFEPFGLTVAEACAAKVPVLVSNVGGPAEIIEYGKYGMIFKSENVDDLADKIYSFIHEGYDMSMVENAYKHTLERYDVSITVNRYMEAYKKMLDNQ